MKLASISLSGFEKVITLFVLGIFLFVWTIQFWLLFTHPEALRHARNIDNGSFVPFYILSHIPVFIGLGFACYFSGMSINLYEDKLEYMWFSHHIRTIRKDDLEMHVYRFFFKNYLAIYDRRNKKLYKVYSKQRTNKFIDYIKTHNLAIVHDGYKPFREYLKKNHPRYKNGF
jgi:hypothetical protein